MKWRATRWLLIFTLIPCGTRAGGQETAPKTEDQTAASTETEKKNLQEYITLLRENLAQEKAQILGGVMQFTPAQAAKFWPIYDEYDTELNKLNDLRLENIKSYARDYSQMTDENADRLTNQAMDFQRRRADLLFQYYQRVKGALGATKATQFLQVENQLLSLIDLQIDQRLPIAGQGS
jgi:hypothetical protein